MFPQVMLFRMHDPRAAYFNRPLGYMISGGLVDYYFRRLTPFLGIKDYVELKEEKLVFEHYYLPCWFWCGGILIATSAIIGETLRSNKRHTNRINLATIN